MRTLIKLLLPVLLAPALSSTSADAAATEPYGLDAMAQFERLPYLKLDTMAGGQSSYDRTGGNADCSNFLQTNGTEKVLLDLNGPGTVYRLWFTGFVPSTDYIKVYFDGESTPRINRLLKDVFSGAIPPIKKECASTARKNTLTCKGSVQKCGLLNSRLAPQRTR